MLWFWDVKDKDPIQTANLALKKGYNFEEVFKNSLQTASNTIQLPTVGFISAVCARMVLGDI